MRKTITYSTFTIAAVLVAMLFVTSRSYSQLALAVILYPAIAYLAFQLFPRKVKQETIEIPQIETEKSVPSTINSVPAAIPEAKTGVSDIDKRAFLKLIGAAGLSVFLFSLFTKRGQIPFFGKASGSDSVTLKDSQGKTVNPSQSQPFDGYQISEIDDGITSYYGFIHQNGAWFIMKEDSDANSFRYAKGSGSFPKSWAERTRIKYDYFYNV